MREMQKRRATAVLPHRSVLDMAFNIHKQN